MTEMHLDDQITRKTFNRSIIRILSIPVILICMLFAYYQYDIGLVTEITQKINRLSEVLLNIARLERALSDTRSGLRGHVLFKDTEFLNSYNTAREKAKGYKFKISSLLDRSPKRQKEFTEVFQDIDAWLDSIDERQIIRLKAHLERPKDLKSFTSSLSTGLALNTKAIQSIVDFELSIINDKALVIRQLKKARRATSFFENVYILFILIMLIILLYKEVNRVIQTYQEILEKNIRSSENIKKASEEKDLFLANISHEMRTPLTAIIGFSGLISEENCLSLQLKDYLYTVQKNAEHLLVLMNDLFDISKINARKVDLVFKDVELRKVIHLLHNTHKDQLIEKSLNLNIDIRDSLPQFIIIDETRVRQILSNLIGNAIKFSPRDKEINLIVCYESEILTIEVIDTGIGIAQDKQESIFSTFSQGDSSHSRVYGGAGLGLAISRELATLMGGDLSLVKSELNNGSHFMVTIKAKEGLQEQVVNKPVAVENQDLSGHKILLAEDSKENQILFKIFIESSGADLDIANNGQEAVDMVIENNYDLCILDIQMPILDGREAVKQIRSNGYKKPIFALTSHTLKGEKQKSLDAGFDDFLTKPVSKNELIDKIQTLIVKNNQNY